MRNLLGSALAAAMLAFASLLPAQQTVGLFQYDPATTDGYTLLAPNPSNKVYLLDNCGRSVHEWTSTYTPGNSVRLLEDGTLLHTSRLNNTSFPAGGLGGRIERLDWNSNVTWSYNYSDNAKAQHHDCYPMPNGNFLFIAWENKTRAEAIAAGRDSTLLQQRLWPDHLVEVQPTTPGNGNIVWEWHAWDHLVQDHDSTKANFGVVGDHPELIDLNYIQPGQTTYRDWLHTNAVCYNADLDQIAISIHAWSEIWVIDHSTTTLEAAGHTGGVHGHGGDLLYRFGNPQTYRRGTVNDQVLFGMHDIQWVPAGDQYAGQMMCFNNGLARPAGNYSTIEIWQPPVDVQGNYTLNPGQAYGPAAMSWTYQATPPTDLYSSLISGVQRLAGNHTQVCVGNSGRIFQLDDQGNMVWEYVNPIQNTGPLNQGDPANNNSVFRAYKYEPTYPGLVGQSLSPGVQLEGNPLPLPSICMGSGVADEGGAGISVWPNPFEGSFHLRIEDGAAMSVEVLDMTGRHIAEFVVDGNEVLVDLTGFPAGLYAVRVAGKREGLRVVKGD
ncbi:MAG: aryl-sulfate sulfotransferase [Bacteroidia bacterium]